MRCFAMNVLSTHVNPSDDTFKANRDRMQQLVGELRERVAAVRQGGGPKYLQRHREHFADALITDACGVGAKAAMFGRV